MLFKNSKTGESMSVYDMFCLISEEAQNNWESNYDEPWCNLTRDEQNKEFSEQFERHFQEDWNIVFFEDLILEGLKQNLVKIIERPNDGCVACEIGDSWFYFIGCEDENMSPAEVLSSYSLEDLRELISSAVEGLDTDERLYYHTFLEENLK